MGQVQEGLEEGAVGQDRELSDLVPLGLADARLHRRPKVIREQVAHDRATAPKTGNRPKLLCGKGQ